VKKLAAAILLLGVLAHPSFTSDGYHLVKKIPIPGSGSWDYLTLDENARRVHTTEQS